MATSYTSLLRLAQPATGELDGTWGDVVNDNITAMVEEALAGRVTIDVWTADAHTLTTANGTTDEARNMFLNLTDTTTDLTGAGELIVPASTKMYVVANGTGQEITVKTSGGTGVAVPDGETNIVYCDGTNVEPVIQLPASTIMARLASGDTKAVTPAELRTLINVEDNADVTDATNVDAAGAVMNTDTSTAAMSFVVDEDNMASDSATKVPTQQSTKAYVDGILIDEDNFASDSATKAPTQQSTKAYVDGKLIDEDNFSSNTATQAPTQQSTKAYVDGKFLDEDDFASDSATDGATQQSTKAYVDGKFLDEDDFASDSATDGATQQSIKAYVDGKSSIGKQELYIPAEAIQPHPGSSPCGALTFVGTSTSNANELGLPFDATTIEYAVFTFALPKRWNGGNISFSPVYTTPVNTGGFTNHAMFSLQVAAAGDSDSARGSLSTAVNSITTGSYSNYSIRVGAEETITLSGSGGDRIYAQIYRNASNGSDTWTGDAYLLGVKIFWTSDAVNDA